MSATVQEPHALRLASSIPLSHLAAALFPTSFLWPGTARHEDGAGAYIAAAASMRRFLAVCLPGLRLLLSFFIIFKIVFFLIWCAIRCCRVVGGCVVSTTYFTMSYCV